METDLGSKSTEWLKKEAEYRKYLDSVPPRIRAVFEGYTHDYDLSQNPLAGIGRRLLRRDTPVVPEKV